MSVRTDDGYSKKRVMRIELDIYVFIKVSDR